ncbi:MAG: MAPEG family protein [Rhizobium sp.]|nr:MAPEG family protein [Rhizobium sp.]
MLGYIGWTLLLLLVMETLRSALVLGGKRRSDSFRPDGGDASPFGQRLLRAHANCLEGFPIFGGLMLLALVLELTALTDPLAPWLLAARVAQSSVHLLSVSAMAINVRFAFFAVQLTIAAWWCVQLLQAGLAA